MHTTLHSLAHHFAPQARQGLAFSAMPDAPVMPIRPARHRTTVRADVRRIGARLRSSFPLATTAPAPVRADCTN